MVRIDGNDIAIPGNATLGGSATVAGQVSVATAPTASGHVVPLGNPRVKHTSTAVKMAVNANATGDTAIPIPLSKYIVEKMIVASPTDDHGACVAGLYSAAGASGELITDATLSSLDSTDHAHILLAAAPMIVLTGANVYFHVSTASGNAGTFDVILFLIDLSSLANT